MGIGFGSVLFQVTKGRDPITVLDRDVLLDFELVDGLEDG